MADRGPSRTASIVAFLRAIAHEGLTSVEGFRDPTARALLSKAWARQVDRLASAPRGGLVHEVACSSADLLALRTLTIDAALRDALARGARQVVILGAGLDGRAFRMRELAGADVYEVDHPAMQRVKRERTAAMERVARSLRFVATDFESGALDEALAAAGHRTREPTVWIWEGVVMYLTRAALRATLRHVAARSAPRSTLIAEYHTPGDQGLAARLLLRLWRESLVGLATREEMASELASAGFGVAEDTGMAEWVLLHPAPMPRYDGAKRVRVVVATR